jgi:hypothetical protein
MKVLEFTGVCISLYYQIEKELTTKEDNINKNTNDESNRDILSDEKVNISENSNVDIYMHLRNNNEENKEEAGEYVFASEEVLILLLFQFTILLCICEVN